MTAMTTTPVGLDLDQAYRLAEQVSLRPEGFGALAYHFGNRRLTFLTSPALVRLVESLDGTRPLRAVLDERVTDRSRAAVESALAGLARAEVLEACPTANPA